MRRCWDLKLRRRTLTFYTVGCKWGVSCLPGWGGTGASVRGEFTLFSLFCFLCDLLLFTFLLLHFLSLSGAGSTKKGWFPERGGPQTGGGGTMLRDWGTRKDGSGSDRFRGRGFLWASEGSNVTFLHIPAPPPHKKICHTPSTTIPPGVHRTWCLWSCRPGNEVCLSSCSSSFRGGHPH